MTSSAVSFVERRACVVCTGETLAPVWSSSFKDGDVPRYIADSKYSCDVMPLIADVVFTMARCATCGMVFHKTILSDACLGTLYSSWIDEQQIAAAEQRRDRFESTRQLVKNVLRLKALVERRERVRILDYGCGSGEFLTLCRLFGWDAHGIDLSASRRTQSLAMGIEIYPALSLREDRELYDAVTLFQVLEHVPDPAGLLREIIQHVRPGGVVLLEVPDTRRVTVPTSLQDFLLVHPLEHINAFTPQTLRALGERCGLSPLPRLPAHATTTLMDIARTEATRIYAPPSTQQFFRRT